MIGLMWAQLRERPITTLLHVVLLALGVATAVAMLLFSAQTGQRLERDAQGIDLVIGAKGSPLQLTLSSVFHADVPTGNIPYTELQRLRDDPRVRQAIPLGLGDSVRGHRIVGTEPAYVALYGAELAQGAMFEASMQAVLGAETARTLGLKVGDTFAGRHGLGDGGAEHEYAPYTVVGVLAPTASVIDRLALTPLESVWDVHEGHDHAPTDVKAEEHDHDHSHDHAAEHPPERPRETTAILLQLKSPVAALGMRQQINKDTAFLAARPADEAARLFSLVGLGVETIRIFALVLIAAAAASVFVTLSAALNDRRGEIALLRAMGATQGQVFTLLLLQGFVIAALGVAFGIGLGHLLVEMLAQNAPQARGFGLTGWAWAPGESWIIVGGLAAGLLAALPAAIRAYRTDIAKTLAEAG
jgi:putative ABC transport system permease protein